MTIQNQNAEVYRGDTGTLNVSLTDVNGDPFVLSGSGEVKYRMSRTADEAEVDALVRKELAAGIIINDSIAEITLLAADTDWPPGVYYHELKIYDLGDVATAMTGAFIVRHTLRTTPEELQPSQFNVIVHAEVI